MSFDKLLTRADAALLQSLVGEEVVKLLSALEAEQRVTTGRLRQVLLGLRSPQELLLDSSSRSQLLELLRPLEAQDLCAHLTLKVSQDPFATLCAVELRRGTRLALALLSYFGLPEPTRDPEPPVPPTAIQGGYELFPHQRQAAIKASRMLRDAPFKVLVHMPTGSGKTRTAVSIVAEHLRDHEEALVLWLAAAEELCDQAAEEFERAWARVGDRTIPICRYWGAHAFARERPRDGIVIAGLAKLYERSIDDPPWIANLADRVTLVVFDEAHQAVAPTYRHVVEAVMARRERTGLLGLTATPGRTWNDPDADEELAKFFSKRKVTLQVDGYTSPVDYLVDNGYLAAPSYRTIEHQGPELTEEERRSLGSQLEIPSSILRRLADDHIRNLYIANEIRSLARRHRRILVFGTTVSHAQKLAIVLSAQGIAARAVTASTPSSERASAIRWYRQSGADETRVLTNFGVLTTGFDAPKTSAAVIARPTKSLVLYSQMIGRAIRGERAGGNKTAEIVTVVDTGLPGFRNLWEAFTNWEDIWQ